MRKSAGGATLHAPSTLRTLLAAIAIGSGSQKTAPEGTTPGSVRGGSDGCAHLRLKSIGMLRPSTFTGFRPVFVIAAREGGSIVVSPPPPHQTSNQAGRVNAQVSAGGSPGRTVMR